MAEIVLGRWKPGPGVRAEELELPGPGLYEADFAVPGWLLPDLDVQRSFEFQHAGSRIQHIRSTVEGSSLTVRFRVLEDADKATANPQTQALFLGLTVAGVLRGVAAVILGTLAVQLVQGIVEALTEVRKLGETPAGIGLGALGVAGALVWLGIRKAG